ncbi:MAG TPA: prephenate dehydratase domain-containing protein [Acidimicrobiia bacterium]|nr:prephenate dehydratase domain-containing protein [Acidimicrobiia bacterium]
MKVGYQGEERSYSHQAVIGLYPDAETVGLHTFTKSFAALTDGSVDRLVVPIENSTTGSILEVLDRLATANVSIVAEHYGRVRHALIGLPDAKPADIRRVLSHPEALAQARDTLAIRGWEPVAVADTAGAVRLVAEGGDPTLAALAPPDASQRYGLRILLSDVTDRDHNATRFVALAPGPPTAGPDDDKSSIVFSTGHRPGALALALTELGLRGANLTRIESRPGRTAWSYRFYVDLLHKPGPAGLSQVLDPTPGAIDDLLVLGTYRAAR